MKVNEAMTRDVRVANHGQSIREAAQMMVDLDAGARRAPHPTPGESPSHTLRV
jgi:hypothetical protein